MKTGIFILLILSLQLIFQGCKNGTSVPEQPNILFIAVDDLNDWTGTMGGNNQAITPNLDLLTTQGVLFSNAHASMPVCVASRNSLLSGLHPVTTGWYTGVGERQAMIRSYHEVMEGKKMLPEFFKDNGYKTFCAGKIFHSGATDYPFLLDSLWDDVAPGYADKVTGKFLERGEGYGGLFFYPFPKNGSQLKRHYGDKLGSGHSLCGGPLDEEDIPGGKMYDELIADYAVQKLNENHDNPFFLSVGFVRPHVPYTAPRKYFDLYDEEKVKIPDVPDDEMKDIPIMGKAIAYGATNFGDHQAVLGVGPDYWRYLVYSYLACISFVDDQIGRVLKALENSRYAENTIIVLWSDHGQNLGEKKHWRKMCLWEESTRVPLCILVPGNKANGQVCDEPVSLLDIYPTLANLCNLPVPEHLDGQNLQPLLEAPGSEWPHVVLSNWMYKNYSVRDRNYRYILYRDGTEELYDRSEDPGEHFNLADNQQYETIKARLKQAIPENPALPAGAKSWRGDKLDELIYHWQVQDSIPVWLR
ncbi:Arylsulfatase A [Mariniphaga anaerophila]|uniref:Arylsulfatase A n=1 Tax=Mariniphaga anaerophila TaxID=1484053 RepID=A0A1M4WLF6_9BACT|nr:sulfatase [Mariniphaga anaerophila]SHE81802.1 Arylsulfatase A [Mariniphaga anaerophila]